MNSIYIKPSYLTDNTTRDPWEESNPTIRRLFNQCSNRIPWRSQQVVHRNKSVLLSLLTVSLQHIHIRKAPMPHHLQTRVASAVQADVKNVFSTALCNRDWWCKLWILMRLEDSSVCLHKRIQDFFYRCCRIKQASESLKGIPLTGRDLWWKSGIRCSL